MKRDNKILFIGAAVLIAILMSGNKLFAAAEKFIMDREGLFLKAYKDTGGIWTIGYGSLYNYDANRRVKEGDQISEAKAIEWLRKEMARKITEIQKSIKVAITDNELNAIISLVYNIGITAFENSTLLKLLNSGASRSDVAAQFLRWNKDQDPKTGKLVEVKGLTNRRNMERDLFLRP